MGFSLFLGFFWFIFIFVSRLIYNCRIHHGNKIIAFSSIAVTDSITVPLNLSCQRTSVTAQALQWSHWMTGLVSSRSSWGFLKRTWTSRTTLRPTSSRLLPRQPSRSAAGLRYQALPLRPDRLWPKLLARARAPPHRKAQAVAPASASPRKPSPRRMSPRRMSPRTPQRLSADVPAVLQELQPAPDSPPRPRTSPLAVAPSPLL